MGKNLTCRNVMWPPPVLDDAASSLTKWNRTFNLFFSIFDGQFNTNSETKKKKKFKKKWPFCKDAGPGCYKHLFSFASSPGCNLLYIYVRLSLMEHCLCKVNTKHLGNIPGINSRWGICIIQMFVFKHLCSVRVVVIRGIDKINIS